MCKSTSICGIDCGECPFKENCKGCLQTQGCPFGEKCILAKHSENIDGLKKSIIDEINSVGIKNFPKVPDLCPLKGSFVNLEYTLTNGQKIKLLNDNRIYLGYQLPKEGTDRCFGICADEDILLICEYGENGINPKIVLYKDRH